MENNYNYGPAAALSALPQQRISAMRPEERVLHSLKFYTCRYARLIRLVPPVIGKTVHVKFNFKCGDAFRQNTVTIATHSACKIWMLSNASNGFRIVGFQLDSQLSLDKKILSWANVLDPRGVEVEARRTISNAVRQRPSDVLRQGSMRSFEELSREAYAMVRCAKMPTLPA